jgi:hypothetical protein
LPDELSRRESRLEKIREAKQALEQEAREKAEQERAETEQKLAEGEQQERRTGKRKRGRKPEPPAPDKAMPADKAQRQGPHGQVFVRGVERNFTDPESRIMPDGSNKGSFVQGYNAQIVTNLEQKPEKISADAGYFSETNLNDEAVAGIDLHIATGRDKHSDPVESTTAEASPGTTARQAMSRKLKTEAGHAVYKMRKAIVEPIFGQIKERRSFRRFSLRGKQNVGHEWRLVCAVSNLLKLYRTGCAIQMA